MISVLQKHSLGIYFLIYFALVFVWPTIRTYRATGKNPIVFARDNSPQGLAGRYFKWAIALIFIYVITFPFFPEFFRTWAPGLPGNPAQEAAGWILLIASALWTVLAQSQMRDSWRIGIDEEEKTKLVTHGVFSISRNPIFTGILVSLLGLCILTPNSVALFLSAICAILIQMQVRFEEAYLIRSHGSSYLDYMKKVRRFF